MNFPTQTRLELKRLQLWCLPCPPGRVLSDFLHRIDELVGLVEGVIEVEIEGKAQKPQIGVKVFIPANAVHTVRNVGQTNNGWFFGYRNR